MIRPEGFCRPDVGICLRVLRKGLSKVIGGKGANVVARNRAPGREQNALRLALSAERAVQNRIISDGARL